MTTTDHREVQELEDALAAMRQAKTRNLYDHRKIRMGLSKNIRLHEQALKEPKAELEDVEKEHQQRDEKGRRLFRASDGRLVVETKDGNYIYRDSGDSYITEEDQTTQVQAGGQPMSRAEMKQRSILRLWEDVEAMNEAREAIRERKVEVDVFVLCGNLASVVLDPSVRVEEENFLYLFHDFRQMMGKEVPESFEPTPESELERADPTTSQDRTTEE
jgi:hypothetical protein